MFIGDILVDRGLIAPADLASALERQSVTRESVGECLIGLGKLERGDLEAVIEGAPVRSNTIEATGLALPDLMGLLVKALHSKGGATPSGLCDMLKLAPLVVMELLAEANDQQLLNNLGAASPTLVGELRYTLTRKGELWAQDALERNKYLGPAPVPLSAYAAQILTQSIQTDEVDEAALERGFADMVVTDDFILEIGPAVNSGRSILLYGPPGNGKSSIAERIGRVFQSTVYIPYCFDVDGQIIKVFDANIHKPISRCDLPRIALTILGREDFDQRWVACHRPLCITGGELTLEMLDLQFTPEAKYYEAPLHIKALGGIFIIDDFGRQLVSPTALLNRWIVPMGSQVEHLKLQNGKSFSLPFDEVIVFCTNLSPHDLMDPAFLRRIPYKIAVNNPSPEEYRKIFFRRAAEANIPISDHVIDYVIYKLHENSDFPLANFQPKFIIDQILTLCRFKKIEPEFQTRFIDIALNNLYTKDLLNQGGARSMKGVIRSVGGG
jgi:hypothetical protein